MRDKVFIYNVGPHDWPVSRSYGYFNIMACPEGTSHSQPLIVTVRKRHMDMGENQYELIDIQAEDVARDIVVDNLLEQHGVFIAAGEKPTPAEISKAKQRLKEFYTKMLHQGDTEWARYHRHEFIDDNSRRACQALGVKREWAYEVVEKAPCPFCDEHVRVGVVKCPACSAIIDLDRALAAGIIGKEQYGELVAARKLVKAKKKEEAAVAD
jgi:hypothetical protein